MKNKYFYYVVVQSEQQAKFITQINNKDKTCFWEKDKKPLAISKSYAEDLAYCLNINGYPTFILTSYYEIENQIFLREDKKQGFRENK